MVGGDPRVHWRQGAGHDGDRLQRRARGLPERGGGRASSGVRTDAAEPEAGVGGQQVPAVPRPGGGRQGDGGDGAVREEARQVDQGCGVQMIVEFDGRQWEWDPEADITVKEATVLRLWGGFSVEEWLDGLKKLDERSWTFTCWLLRKRNGVTGPIAGLDFPLLTFVAAYRDAARASREGLDDLPEEG